MESRDTTAALQTVQDPTSLISQAIEKGLGVAELEKLLGLQERWEATQARKAFFEAFTDFQCELPELRKTREVRFKETDLKPQYHFASLGDIARQLKDLIKKHRFSYRWEIGDEGDKLKVTCLLSHSSGHTERTTMTSPADPSGGKNGIQSRGSAVQYLKRYTLEGALGLTTTEADIDGQMPGDYEYNVDELHKKFMAVYGEVIKLDSTLTKFDPDNWLIERTGKNYVRAIGDIRKVLFDLQQKKK